MTPLTPDFEWWTVFEQSTQKMCVSWCGTGINTRVLSGSRVVCWSGRGMELSKEVFPAATDSRYLRLAGIPSLGFSVRCGVASDGRSMSGRSRVLCVPSVQPMCNTEVLLHDHNEHIPVDVYVKGINTYVTLLGDLINTIKPTEQARGSTAAPAESS